MTNNSPVQAFFIYTSNNGVGSWVNVHRATNAVTSAPMTAVFELDINIGTNQFMQLQAESGFSAYLLQTLIIQIPTSYTIIQNTTQNNYINPPTSQMTYLSVWNNLQGVTSFINGGASPNPWRMCLTVGSYNIVTGGNVSLVYAPNISTPAYIEISKTALYKINVVYDQYVPTIGGVNTYFNVNFYNITDSVVVAFCPVYYNNLNTSIN